MSEDQYKQWHEVMGQGGDDTANPTEVVAVNDRVQCPYNFVPCPDHIVEVKKGDQVTQDVPFRDGIGGHIEVEINTHAPIFIPDPERRQHFFSLPGGEQAIPATSLRGMLRSTVEIASFGRMNPVNDHRFSVRDLSRAAKEIYQKPMKMVSAGWLTVDPSKIDPQTGDPRWQIEPVNWAKVHYKHLEAHFPGIKFGEKRAESAVVKYKHPKLKESDLRIQAKVEPKGDPANDGEYKRLSHVGEVEKILGKKESGQQGTLVFTGQPSPWTREKGDKNKKHNFFFYGDAGEPLPISPDVVDAFEFVHSNSGEQHRNDRKPNEEWDYWRKEMKRNRKVPVFFLANMAGQVTAFGFASLFRLPGDLSVAAAVANAQGQLPEDRFDMAEAIFGRVHGSDGVRGRVRIGPGRLQSQPEEGPSRKVVLGAPKPQFFPFYLQQDEIGKVDTWLNPKASAAGWKRYQVRKKPWIPATFGKSEAMTNVLHPLEAGVAFRSRVHVHNLRPFELGALLWAIDFGGRENCFHALGRGRPLGLGKVQLNVNTVQLRDVQGDPIPPEKLDQCRNDFRIFMENACIAQNKKRKWGSWEYSDTIQELVAIATEFPAEQQKKLEYMSRDEYRRVKAESGRVSQLASPRRRLKHAGVEIPPGDVVARPEVETQVEEVVEEKVTVPPSQADAQYQEARDSGGDTSGAVAELAHGWMADSGSEETADRKAVIKDWFYGLTNKKKSRYQDIIDWCKE
jgi:CRISPR-associated protein (TIGR03986 family)